MKIDTAKIIGDPIHGYIPLTALEYDLIQLPTMNRLHHIHQTAMAYLTFPGSVTTRFSHVIGAVYVGNEIITQLLSTLEKSEYFKELFPELPSQEFLVKAVRLACLFHDVGHGPYSHSSEDAMLEVTKQHGNEVETAKKLFDPEGKSTEVPIHEFFSYMLIKDGEIGETIQSEQDGQLLKDTVLQLLIKNKDDNLYKNNQGFRLIRNIVSSQLDADRFDYLLRDSAMSGVKFGFVDIDRIIKNMAIIRRSESEYDLAINERAIGNIEDMLDARFKMYRWFYSHHAVVVTNELIKIAVDMLIEEPKTAELFHWSEYKNGQSTDEVILNKIRVKVQEDERYLKVKGLIDRRYFPISFFKSTPAQAQLIAEIAQHAQKKEELPQIRDFIITYFKDEGGAEKIQTTLEKADPSLQNCIIIHTDVRMKPYQPFKKDEKIWLFRAINGSLCELSGESDYFRNVNDAWKNYHGFFVCYLFPDVQRKVFHTHKSKIREIMAVEIATAYRSSS